MIIQREDGSYILAEFDAGEMRRIRKERHVTLNSPRWGRWADPSRVTAWQSGRVKPSDDTILKIAETLKCPLMHLMKVVREISYEIEEDRFVALEITPDVDYR